MEEQRYCKNCWGRITDDATNCPYCGIVLDTVSMPVPPTPAELGYTKKETKQSRKLYRDFLFRRDRKYLSWIIAAAAWGIGGFLFYIIGALDGNDSPIGTMIKLFDVPAVIILLLALWSKVKNKKKLQVLQAKVDAMDPTLVAVFKWEIMEQEIKDRHNQFKIMQEKADKAEAEERVRQIREEERQREFEKQRELDYMD